MADESMSPSGYRAWLQEKVTAGVKHVRAATALAQSPDPAKYVEVGSPSTLAPQSPDHDPVEGGLLARIGERPVTYETPQGPVLVSGPLVGTKEVAAILRVERPRIGRWMSLGNMLPKPVAELGAGPVWLRSDIEALRGQTEARRKPRKAASGEVSA